MGASEGFGKGDDRSGFEFLRNPSYKPRRGKWGLENHEEAIALVQAKTATVQIKSLQAGPEQEQPGHQVLDGCARGNTGRNGLYVTGHCWWGVGEGQV